MTLALSMTLSVAPLISVDSTSLIPENHHKNLPLLLFLILTASFVTALL
jgi:hypothetical protein